MIKNKGNFISGVVIFFVAGFMFFFSLGIKSVAGMTIAIGSDLLPKVVAILLMCFSAILVVTNFTFKKNIEPQPEVVIAPSKQANISQVKAVLISIALITVYIAMMEFFGFIISTMLYLFAQFIVLAPKKKVRYIGFLAIAIPATFIIYFIFVRGFSLMLPRGLVFNF
ncbi:MAG: tripartite tricarboxylate transporter TctB family protein [Sphaerochaeta sp.]|nr:tripartite tricarboxylate transporter TctB family protein [Sphaerochaeta sp.]